jgi:hypothetical protein
VEVNDAAREAAFVEELERRADVLRSAGLPPPTTIGVRNRWHSSTSPDLIACPASSAPQIVMSGPEVCFSRRIAPISKSGSIRVLALDTV